MNKISCVAGETQIGRVLKHTLNEHSKAAVQALTFIGDALEEAIDPLAGLAGQLGAQGVPLYIFQEGRDARVRGAFQTLATLSNGRYFEFNPDTPQAVEQLSGQLTAVARLAVGDSTAMAALTDQRRR
jgi:hypothetical protein